MTLGTTLLLPVVPSALVGLGLLDFGGGLLGDLFGRMSGHRHGLGRKLVRSCGRRRH